MKRDSNVINFIRFPLAFMVVMLHSYVAVQGFNILQVDYSALSGADIYSLFCITFSHVLTQVAVPLFFLISGYLFYIGFENWDWLKYANKLKRRVKTLLVPYLMWNTIQSLIIIGIFLLSFFILGKPLDRIGIWFKDVGGLYGIYWSCQETIVVKEDVLGVENFKSFPLLTPMWFIRDLMVVVLLQPLLWWFLKRVPYILLPFGFLWIIGASIPVPGFSYRALFFFALGSVFSIKSVSFSKAFGSINKWLLSIVFVVFGIVSVLFDGNSTKIGQVSLSIWILAAIPTAYRISSCCLDKYPSFAQKIQNLSRSTYFVFAFHGVIIYYVYSALWMLFGVVNNGNLVDADYLKDHVVNGILAYLLTPVVTVATSLFVYTLVKQVLKKWSWLLAGK